MGKKPTDIQQKPLPIHAGPVEKVVGTRYIPTVQTRNETGGINHNWGRKLISTLSTLIAKSKRHYGASGLRSDEVVQPFDPMRPRLQR